MVTALLTDVESPRPQSMSELTRHSTADWLGRSHTVLTNKPATRATKSGVSQESGVAGPSRAPQPAAAAQQVVQTKPPDSRSSSNSGGGGGSGSGKSRRSVAKDGTYRPNRRRPSDGDDDDYREGEVPEPQPDLTIGTSVEKTQRKRAREMGETAVEAGSSGSETSSGLAKKARTEEGQEQGQEQGNAGLPIEINSGGSSGDGESDLDTPSSRSSHDKGALEEDDEDEETLAEVKRTRGRPRLDKGKAVAVASRRSSPRITRSQAVMVEEDEGSST